MIEHNKSKNEFNSKKFLVIILFLILLICIYLVFIPPYIGMANNGDFQRIINKVGLDYSYDAWDENNFYDSFFRYVVNSYEKVDPVNTGWFTPFEGNVLFSKLLSNIFSKTGTYDIRFMGLSNLITYIAIIGLFFYALSKYSKKMIIIGGLVTLLFASDSYIIQYFNSFYSEMGTLFYVFAFFSLCLLYIKSNYKTKWICWLLEMPISVIATLSKQQEILIILPILIILIMQGFDIFKEKYGNLGNKKIFLRVSMIIFFLTILPIALDSTFNKTTGVNQTSCYNTIMQDILNLSTKPEIHLKSMGFNEEEVSELVTYIGQTAYTNSGYEKYDSYFTRAHELKILLREPKLILDLFRLKATKLFDTVDAYKLGNFLKEDAPPNTKCYAFRIWSNLKEKLYINSLWFYLLVIISSAFISIYHIKKEKKLYLDVYYLVLCLCSINVLQFITIVLGDSIHDVMRHYFVVNIEFDVIFIILICYVINKAIFMIRNK